MSKQRFCKLLKKKQAIAIKYSYHDTKMIVIFAISQLVGGLHDTNIIMIKIMSLFVVLGCCSAQNVNLILKSLFVELILFIKLTRCVICVFLLILTCVRILL